METNFIDYVKIVCRSGKGGRGSAHMHRAKYNPYGGPDGGDGGRGGHVFLRGNRNLWTLLHLRYDRHIFAGHGEHGGKNGSHGADGQDRYIDVPCGTVVYDADTGRFLCDVTTDGQVVQLLQGGRGGLGNKHFATATNQAPRYAQPGEPMQELTVILELKMLADVGLVGFPNAGKSTLVGAISTAHPKVAGYAFTTLEPSVGVVPYHDNRSFVIADIPGIIEGASEGRGLGLRFLRHIERNSVLLFMVPADTDDIAHDYHVLLDELRRYNPEMLDKQRLLAVTKADIIDSELIDLLTPTLPSDLPTIFISAVTGYNIPALKDMLWQALTAPLPLSPEAPLAPAAVASPALPSSPAAPVHASPVLAAPSSPSSPSSPSFPSSPSSPSSPSVEYAAVPQRPSPLSLVHRDKPIAILRDELQAQGEDMDLIILDDDDIDDIDEAGEA